MERHKQFAIFNTSTNCFLCFDQIQVSFGNPISIYSLETVLTYLDIDLSHLSSVVIVSAFQNTRDIRVNLCGECERAVNNFSTHYETLMEQIRRELKPHLEIIKNQLGNLKDNPKMWTDYQRRIQKVADVQAQAQMKIVEELRDKMLEKCIKKHSSTDDCLTSPTEVPNHSEDFQLNTEEDLIASPETADFEDIKVEEVASSPSTPLNLEESKPEVNASPIPVPIETEMALINEKPEPAQPLPKKKKRKRFLHKYKKDEEGRFICKKCPKRLKSSPSFYAHLNAHKGKLITCQVCKKVYSTKYDLSVHVKTYHSENKPEFKCRFCPKIFVHRSNLRIHLRTHAKDGKGVTADMLKYKCKVCDKILTSGCDLKKHMRHHTGEKPFKCSVCEKTFRQREELKTHMGNHTGEKPQCPVCGKKYATNFILRKHKCQTGPFTCSTCQKVFKEKAYLTIHMESHKTERSFKCDACGIAYKKEGHLKAHLQLYCTKGQKNTFLCGQCPSSFDTKRRLHQHLWIHKDKRFKCPHCEKCFRTNQNLKLHLRTHSDERPFNCDLCGKLLQTRFSLSLHVKNHGLPKGQKTYNGPFPCTICGKVLATKGSLRIHMMMHKDEKPVKCDHCDKTFRNKTSLRLHSVVHAKQGLIPVSEEFLKFKCKVCEKVFANKTHLQDHERLHTGEKPFQCGTCGKAFAQKWNLTCHEDAVHSGTTYPCSVCGRGFTTKRNLAKHERLIHKEESKE